jgi:hypothetical protein
MGIEMRSSEIVITLGIMFVLGVAVAARADKVTAYYDHAVDFSKYKTFMWIRKPEGKDPFMEEHIVAAVDEQLVNKGLRQVSEGADLAVGANLTTQQGHACEAYDDGTGWRWDGWSNTNMKTYELGTLTVDLFDGHSGKLAWQGVAVDEVSTDPIKRTRETFREIEKMFKDYPLKTHD